MAGTGETVPAGDGGRGRRSRAIGNGTLIALVGLGPGRLDSLSIETLRALDAAACLLLRTVRHPAADDLRARGTAFTALDAHYEAGSSLPAVYAGLAAAVLERARAGDVTYAVPGHPLIGEESVRLIIEAARANDIPWRILPAQSFLDPVLTALASAGEEGDFSQLQLVDAAALGEVWSQPALPALLYQVDDQDAASRAKLALMEVYPDDHPACVVHHAGIPGEERVIRRRLFELDRGAAGPYDHLVSIYLPPLPAERRRPDFQQFVEIIARLRAPGGCPWDREQTPQTLKRFVLEEAYEVLEAVDGGQPEALCDELGDLMIQVLMYAQFAREDGDFDIRDVIANVVDKLVRRHPHVFGDVTAETSAEVLRNWEQIKRREKPERESILDGVPRDLPALMKAAEVSKRVVRVGFEWPSLDEVFDKFHEELAELREAVAAGHATHQCDEIGDLLFTVVNVARWLKIDPEEALRTMVARFTVRFREVERLAAAAGKPLSELPLAEMEALWQQAKQAEG